MYLYLFIEFYHFLLYVRRPREKYNIHFAFFSIGLFIYFVSRSAFYSLLCTYSSRLSWAIFTPCSSTIINIQKIKCLFGCSKHLSSIYGLKKTAVLRFLLPNVDTGSHKIRSMGKSVHILIRVNYKFSGSFGLYLYDGLCCKKNPAIYGLN